MDRDQFDNFARAISATSSRRRFSALLFGLGIGSTAGLSLLNSDDAEAKNKNKTKRRRARKRKQARQDDTGGGSGGGGTGDGGAGGSGGTGDPVCVPDCTGLFGPKYCGADGCGGECGQCSFLKPICNNITFTCETIFP